MKALNDMRARPTPAVVIGQIGRVNCRRGLLLVILIYFTLDLSLPEMPGAFVFDPAGSVDGIDVARGRLTTKIVVLPTPDRDSLLRSLFKLLLNGTRVEVASGGNEGTSTSVLSGDPGRTAPASALIEMDAATGMLR